MTLQKLPHELIKTLLDGMDFTVSYKSITDLTGGVYRLNDVCKFHHAQIGRQVTIEGKIFLIKEYNYAAKTLTVESYKGTTLDPDTSPLSFTLYRPLFVHGTPVKTEGELKQEDKVTAKTPMVYMMEPYKTEEDRAYDSAIAYRSNITLCYLTECDTDTWTTDQHYHRSIDPMRILMDEVIEEIKKSKLFFTEELKSSPTYHANFGINIREYGQKELLFAERLSGCSDDIRLEVYRVMECEC